MALWAFIIEVVFHGCEVVRGTMSLADTGGMFAACAVMIAWMTIQYKANLYQFEGKKD
jgi:hypothetical protein